MVFGGEVVHKHLPIVITTCQVTAFAIRRLLQRFWRLLPFLHIGPGPLLSGRMGSHQLVRPSHYQRNVSKSSRLFGDRRTHRVPAGPLTVRLVVDFRMSMMFSMFLGTRSPAGRKDAVISVWQVEADVILHEEVEEDGDKDRSGQGVGME